jgi:5-methyltetrahydropteroyltriglutamate--homocysteine methyltransferase
VLLMRCVAGLGVHGELRVGEFPVEQRLVLDGEEGVVVARDDDRGQAKSSFVTYAIEGLTTLAPGGLTIPFADGHLRQLPLLTEGPFRYTTFAAGYLEQAQRFATRPIKQALIAPSALSLLYPEDGLRGYGREEFLDDLADQAYLDIRKCLDAGAAKVQIDFTEGRLAVKLDPSKTILKHFIELNNRVLSRFSPEDRARLGVHTCPGGDDDSTHSLDVPYGELLPELFQLEVGNFYL